MTNDPKSLSHPSFSSTILNQNLYFRIEPVNEG